MEEIDLRELLQVAYEKKFIIILVVIVCLVFGGVYSYYFNTPKYKAVTSMVLTRTEYDKDGAQSSITQTDLTLNQKLVSTYSKIIKSRTVLGAVVRNLEGLNITEDMSDEEKARIENELRERETELRGKEESLKRNITVTSVEDSSMIELGVINEDPEEAAKIANELAIVFSEQTEEMYKISNVYILDTAEVPNGPYNVNHKKFIAIGGAIGLVLAAAYVFMVNMFDNTTKNKENIEKVVGVPVLVSLEKRGNGKRGGANA